jgi:hypothetical protein
MKILVISDIHGRLAKLDRIKTELAKADVVVVAGDITNFGGRDEAREILKPMLSLAKRLFAVPGNCDLPEVNELLKELRVSLHGRSSVVEEIGFFGVGGSNPTPFATPQEYTEEHLRELLESGYSAIKERSTKVLVTHSPPFGTKLDLTSSGMHAGSRAVKAFIKEKKPTLALCGHIHEARGVARVATTTVVNPGAFHMGYALVELDEGKVEIELKEY